MWPAAAALGFYSHGPPQFPGLHQVSKPDWDENGNLDNACSSENKNWNESRPSCVFEPAGTNGENLKAEVKSEAPLWPEQFGEKSSDIEFSALAKSVIEKVVNGSKCSETSRSVVTEPEQGELNRPPDVSDFVFERKPELVYSRSCTSEVKTAPVVTASVLNNGAGIPRKHRCVECEYSTDNRSHLRRHISSVHCTVKQFSCYICGKDFSRQEKVKVHIARVHPEVEYDRDRIKKGELIKALEKSDADKIEKERMKCDGKETAAPADSQTDSTEGAEAEFGSSAATSSTKRPHKSYRDLERKFRCPNCKYVGKDVWHLKRHINEIHDGLKHFQCGNCNYSTSRKHRMISHMKSHGELWCFYCSFKISDVALFHEHLTECTKLHRAASYSCTVCGEPFSVRRTYAKHMMESHRQVLYMCDECLFVTLDVTEFSHHKDTHESQGADRSQLEGGEHCCAPCGELFSSEDTLQQHVDEVHSGKVLPATPKEEDLITCSMCDFRTIYRFVMRNHMRKHTGEKFTCDVPGFQATWKNSIQHHKELKHSPVEDHVCPECQKIFHHKLNLKLHMKIHDKRHVCPVCGHSFAQLSFLNKHLAKHQDNSVVVPLSEDDDTAQNFHRCVHEGCLFRSKYRNVLKRHVDSLHRPTGPVDTVGPVDANLESAGSGANNCPVCGKLFIDRYELRNHMFDKHNQVLQANTRS